MMSLKRTVFLAAGAWIILITGLHLTLNLVSVLSARAKRPHRSKNSASVFSL
jgi:hypothetical protein